MQRDATPGSSRQGGGRCLSDAPAAGRAGEGLLPGSRPLPLGTWTSGPAAAPRLRRRRLSESYLLYCSAFRWPRRLLPRSTPADGEAAPAALVGTPRPSRTAGGHLRPRRSGTVRGEPSESRTPAGAEAPPAAGAAPPPAAFGPAAAAVCGSASGKQRGEMGGWLRVYNSVHPVLCVLRRGGSGNRPKVRAPVTYRGASWTPVLACAKLAAAKEAELFYTAYSFLLCTQVSWREVGIQPQRLKEGLSALEALPARQSERRFLIVLPQEKVLPPHAGHFWHKAG